MLLGLCCVVIGSIGIVVPGLPTTVFFIGAAAAFSRSSPRLEAWVLGLPGIGPTVRDFRAGLGMPRRAKIVAIVMVAVAITLSSLVISTWWLRLVVIGAGVVGVIVITRVPTRVDTIEN